MTEELIVGLLFTFVPAVLVGYLVLRQQTGIFRLFVALLLVGLGYLSFTGAMSDIGGAVLGYASRSVSAKPPAAAPIATEPATAPAEPAAPAATEPPPASEEPEGEPPPAPEMPDTGAAPPPAEGETPLAPGPAETAPAPAR